MNVDVDAAYDEACPVCFMDLHDICALQQQTGTCCCGDDGETVPEDDEP